MGEKKKKKRDFRHFEQTVVKKASTKAASNLGRDKQLSAITSPNVCAEASLISLIMNNGGGNRRACLCKFNGAVISFVLNGQNSGAASFFSVNSFTFFIFCPASSLHCRPLPPPPPLTALIKVQQTAQSGTVLIPHLLSNLFLLDSRSVLARPEAWSSFFSFLHSSFLARCSSISSSCFSMPLICIFIVSLLALLPTIASVYIYFLISPLCFAIITLFYCAALSPLTTCGSGLNIAGGHYEITALQHLSCSFFSSHPPFRRLFVILCKLLSC